MDGSVYPLNELERPFQALRPQFPGHQGELLQTDIFRIEPYPRRLRFPVREHRRVLLEGGAPAAKE